jgi:hypothetical protein
VDTSITLITPDMQRERGAHAFDQGLGVDDHHMNPGAPAIRDWQFGWHTRRIERSRKAGNHVPATGELLGCPP